LRSPEEPVALPEMATSCASHRRVTGCFRIAVIVIPHDDVGRSRSPFTRRGNRSFPCTLLWIQRSPGIPSQRCCVSPVVPFDFCNEIVKRRVAFCGRDPRSPRRSVWRCSIESTVLPSTSRRPLRRRRNARVERRVVRSLRRAELAWHPPHRTWGPARGCTLLEPFPRTT
jgi:hypothetical protein